jgi:hypothetical protein
MNTFEAITLEAAAPANIALRRDMNSFAIFLLPVTRVTYKGIHLLYTIAARESFSFAVGRFAERGDLVMSRTEPRRPVAQQGSAEQKTELLTIQEKREELITPLVTRLQALWSKETLHLTSDEIHLLQLMSTLVRLSDLDVLQTLPIANEIMPPTQAWDV